MKIGVIGRTSMLLDSARALALGGHEIPFVITATGEDYYTAGEDDFAAFAEEVGAWFKCTGRLSGDEMSERLAAADCDVVISMNWPTIIVPDFLEAFEHGIYNAHPGMLPRYRGNACPNWAILNGEDAVGLTIHKMATELDAGPIAIQKELPINDETYIGDVYAWLATAVPEAFVDLVGRLDKDNLQHADQENTDIRPLRCFPRRPDDSRVVWTANSEEILRLIRASSHPFAGAFSFLENETRVKILRAMIEPDFDEFLAVPGQVVGARDGDPLVATGNGVLRLAEIEIDGIEWQADAKKLITKTLRHRLI